MAADSGFLHGWPGCRSARDYGRARLAQTGKIRAFHHDRCLELRFMYCFHHDLAALGARAGYRTGGMPVSGDRTDRYAGGKGHDQPL